MLQGMEEGESLLEAIYDDDKSEDIEMIDVEEGECTSDIPLIQIGKGGTANKDVINHESKGRNRRRRKNKKNKKKKNGLASDVTDINRFVLDICKRLKEKKSYMVYTAVGCLGMSVLRDLVKEVDAIQVCGGQMTADGRRHRTGGGILWSIIKAREPKAYKEIMNKAKEFEKQFKQQIKGRAPDQKKDAPQATEHAFTDSAGGTRLSDGAQVIPQTEVRSEQDSARGARVSVHDRIRMPVSYDDLIEDDRTANKST